MRTLVGVVVAVVTVTAAGHASAHDGHGLGCAYPHAQPAVCGADYPLPDEVWHAIGHGVSVQVLRDSLASPEPEPSSSLPDTVTVGNGRFVVPDDVAVEIEQHVDPEAQLWTLRVAACESGLDPFAINPASGATGLFQHLWRFVPGRVERFAPGADVGGFRSDVELQVVVTEGLRVEQGTTPWAASRHCWGTP